MKISEATKLYCNQNIYIKPATKKFYEGNSQTLINEFGDFELLSLTKQQVKEMINQMKTHVKNTTINKRITMLKTYINYFIEEELIEPKDNLIKITKMKKLPNDCESYEPLNENEEKAFLEYCTFDEKDTIAKRRNKVMFLLNYHTGFRRSELLNIKCEELDFEKGIIFIHHTKTSKPRPAIIPPMLIEDLKIMVKQGSDYLFHTSLNTPLTINTFDNLYKDLSQVLGFKISSHKLRHTFAINLLNKTKNIQTVQKLLGHNSLSTTSVYLNTSFKKALEEQANAYNV